MNTDTGRIYDPETMGDYRSGVLRQKDDALFAELAAADAERKLVPVSEQVAQTMKLGQRELERRGRRRKAAKQARKKNRT